MPDGPTNAWCRAFSRLTTWKTCSTCGKTKPRSQPHPSTPKITNRGYQLEAVRRVVEAFEQGKRKALLVMATGTGKTRVAMSLVDVFLRSNQARRILFVADRDALVVAGDRRGLRRAHPRRTLHPHLRLRHRQDQAPVRRHAADAEQLLRPVHARLLRPDHLRRGASLDLQQVERGAAVLRRSHDRADRHARGLSSTATPSWSSSATTPSRPSSTATRRPCATATWWTSTCTPRRPGFSARASGAST